MISHTVRRQGIITWWQRLALAAVVLALCLSASPGHARAAATIATRTLAETKLAQLPAGPLFWRLESFPTSEAAQAASGATGLIIEESDRTLLATLHTGGSAPGAGTSLAEIGPVAPPQATTYLLRVVELTGPAGSTTAIHMHPGAEAYYVLSGQISVHSLSGNSDAAAGAGLVGPAAGSAMQVINTGTGDLRAFALFVVDADQSFSAPATFEKPDCTYFPETGRSLCAGFRAYWEQFGGLAVYGYPISGEFVDGSGHTVQWFERARFEWHPGQWPERYDVLLGRVGAELSAQQGFDIAP